jgi:hypothetical protein
MAMVMIVLLRAMVILIMIMLVDVPGSIGVPVRLGRRLAQRVALSRL